MENNEDTHTNMMDLLPDEMVIKIFEHFETLADLTTIPKVNHRFNELSKQKCSRNHLLFKANEIAAYSEEELNRKMQEEIDKCRDLQAVTFKDSRQFNLRMKKPSSMIIKALSRNSEEEIDEDDIDRYSMANGVFYLSSYLKKGAGHMCRVVQVTPSAWKIRAKGAPKLFLSAIEKSTETLIDVKYEGTNLSCALLIALGKCKKLRMVHLTGNLVVSEEKPENFHKIESKEIMLDGNFHCRYFAAIFLKETLLYFSVRYSTIAEFKNELFTICSKLNLLFINMESEREDIQNNHLMASIIEFVDTLKHHETLRQIIFVNLSNYIYNSISEPLAACLESIADSEINMNSGGEEVNMRAFADILKYQPTNLVIRIALPERSV